MSKTEADNLKKIETSFLKKHDYFSGFRSGTITWTHGWSGSKSSVGINVLTGEEEEYMRVYYTQTDNYSGEKKEFDYKIPLTTTSCRYGGKRYWFICPFSKNGVYCGRRVGVLYKDGDYFACRHCNKLTYESRKLSGKAKAFGRIISIPEMEKAEAEIKRRFYRGNMTKRFKRFLRKRDKADRSFAGMVELLHSKAYKK